MEEQEPDLEDVREGCHGGEEWLTFEYYLQVASMGGVAD